MLEKLRHFGPDTYVRLMALDRDLAGGGPIHQWLSSSLGLTEKQIDQVVRNTGLAAEILRASCEEGKLIFDLDPVVFFVTGSAEPTAFACDGS